MRRESLKIKFLANAAILLEHKGLKILVDGIYDYQGNEFSNLSKMQWNHICNGQEDFSDIKYLIFTHVHSDHFSSGKLLEYLKLQKPKGIIIPNDAIKDNPLLKQCLKENSIPSLLLNRCMCNSWTLNLDKEVCIKFYYKEHLDVGENNLQHFCILIRIGNYKLFFTGDVNFSTESFEFLKNENLDAVFINPLFYLSNQGKNHFENGNLNTRKQIIYHIPFEENDVMGMRKIMEFENSKGIEDRIFLLTRGETIYL